jgi:hypothetical protein
MFDCLEERDLPAPLTWAGEVNLPTARGGVVAAPASGGGLVVLGGPTADVPSFAAANPTWQTALHAAAALDQARASPGVGVTPDGGLLVFGGQNSEGESLASAVQYNATGGGTQAASMSTLRALPGFATDEIHHVYAIGGRGDDGGVLASVEWYSQSANAWTTVAPLPQRRYALSAVADGAGHVFAIGGLDDNDQVAATVYRYTIATNTWDTVAPLPVATRSSAAVLAPNGLIYVLGGVTSAGTTASVESYNETTNTWTAESPLPAPLSSEAAAVNSLGRIIVAGGFDANHNATASVYFSQQLNQPDAAPSITSTPPRTAVAKAPSRYQVLSTGNPQPAYALTAAPAGMTIDANTGLITWTPTPDEAGGQSVTVRASNYAGHVTQTYSVAVIGVPPTGVTAVGASATSLTVSWSAVADPSGATYNVLEKLTISGGGGKGSHSSRAVYNQVASGITTTSYTVTGLKQGSYHTYVVTSVDRATGLASAYSSPAGAQTWFPPSFPQAPAFLVGAGALWSGPVSVTAGQSVQVRLIGAGNPLTYSVASGPKTVSIDPGTGVATYAPAASEVGSVNITFQASNPVGTATQTITFDATAPGSGPTPAVTWAAPAAIPYGTPLSATQLDATASVPGTFVYTPALGTVPAAGTQTLSVTFTPSDTTHYTTITQTVQVVVNQATPAFDTLSSPTVPSGTASITLSGHIAAGPVSPTGDSVSVTLNGVTRTATVDGGGNFSLTVATDTLAAGSYPVTYAFAGDTTNFAAAANGTGTLTVSPAPAAPPADTEPQPPTVPDGGGITPTPTPVDQSQPGRHHPHHNRHSHHPKTKIRRHGKRDHAASQLPRN